MDQISIDVLRVFTFEAILWYITIHGVNIFGDYSEMKVLTPFFFTLLLFISCGEGDKEKKTTHEYVASQSSNVVPSNDDLRKAEEASKYYENMMALFDRELDFNLMNQWLEEEKFDELESHFKKLSKKYEEDPTYDLVFQDCLYIFDRKNPEHLKRLNKWIIQKPSNISYCARGIYKYWRGMYLRGDRFVKDTPPENFQKMREFHQGAIQDLNTAIQQNEKCYPAYGALIETYMANSMDAELEAVHQKGLQLFPGSYSIRLKYLNAIKPRWGGSHKEMKAYSDQFDQAALLNPAIWLLKGEVYIDRASILFSNNQYDEIPKLCTEALKFGYSRDALEKRIAANFYLHNYTEALDDYEKRFPKGTSSEFFTFVKAIGLAHTGKYEEARPLLAELLKLYPEHGELLYAMKIVDRELSKQKAN